MRFKRIILAISILSLIIVVLPYKGGSSLYAQSTKTTIKFVCTGNCNDCMYCDTTTAPVDTVKVAPIIKDTVPTPVAIDTVPAPVAVKDTIVPIKERTKFKDSRFITNFPPFALKTNLLFDAASALNIELEVPINPNWSINLEWNFPWWLKKKTNAFCIEALVGNGEVRYWFQDRNSRAMLEGWFAGVYGGGGYYDIQWKGEGNQGELHSVGFTGGYSFHVHRIFNIELSLGLGYMGTDYRHYALKENNTILAYQYTGQRIYFGPTRAKVSFVWLISSKNYNKKGKNK